MLVAAAVAAAILAWFLERTRFGTAVRAVAQDPEAAHLHGISLGTVARFNCDLGAALSAAVGILVAPLQEADAEVGPAVGVPCRGRRMLRWRAPGRPSTRRGAAACRASRSGTGAARRGSPPSGGT
ncbi:ABC transporter permease subunit [Actinomarinicola tropica]|uniref:ABC transporter permease subunit n=1 Tax=Actinomarinicola tropica TaxID=2789776 RepID=UPI0038991B1C